MRIGMIRYGPCQRPVAGQNSRNSPICRIVSETSRVQDWYLAIIFEWVPRHCEWVTRSITNDTMYNQTKGLRSVINPMAPTQIWTHTRDTSKKGPKVRDWGFRRENHSPLSTKWRNDGLGKESSFEFPASNDGMSANGIKTDGPNLDERDLKKILERYGSGTWCHRSLS